MSELSITGRLTKKLAVESGTSKAGKDWKKGGFVIDTGAQYNNEIAFSLFGDDKINLISNIKEGQEIKVNFNVSSREYNSKYFHNLDAWKIDLIGSTQEPANNSAPADLSNDEDDLDLPF